MTDATLNFEGMATLSGAARHGGDFLIFRTDSTSAISVKAGTVGTVELDGVPHKVALEDVRAVSDGEHSGSEFTLRLFTPIPG